MLTSFCCPQTVLAAFGTGLCLCFVCQQWLTFFVVHLPKLSQHAFWKSPNQGLKGLERKKKNNSLSFREVITVLNCSDEERRGPGCILANTGPTFKTQIPNSACPHSYSNARVKRSEEHLRAWKQQSKRHFHLQSIYLFLFPYDGSLHIN